LRYRHGKLWLDTELVQQVKQKKWEYDALVRSVKSPINGADDNLPSGATATEDSVLNKPAVLAARSSSSDLPATSSSPSQPALSPPSDAVVDTQTARKRDSDDGKFAADSATSAIKRASSRKRKDAVEEVPVSTSPPKIPKLTASSVPSVPPRAVKRAREATNGATSSSTNQSAKNRKAHSRAVVPTRFAAADLEALSDASDETELDVDDKPSSRPADEDAVGSSARPRRSLASGSRSSNSSTGKSADARSRLDQLLAAARSLG